MYSQQMQHQGGGMRPPVQLQQQQHSEQQASDHAGADHSALRLQATVVRARYHGRYKTADVGARRRVRLPLSSLPLELTQTMRTMRRNARSRSTLTISFEFSKLSTCASVPSRSRTSASPAR